MNIEIGKGFSAIGELIVWSNEGGYCDASIIIETPSGQVSMEEIIENLLPGIEMDGGKKGVVIQIDVRVMAKAGIENAS